MKAKKGRRSGHALDVAVTSMCHARDGVFVVMAQRLCVHQTYRARWPDARSPCRVAPKNLAPVDLEWRGRAALALQWPHTSLTGEEARAAAEALKSSVVAVGVTVTSLGSLLHSASSRISKIEDWSKIDRRNKRPSPLIRPWWTHGLVKSWSQEEATDKWQLKTQKKWCHRGFPNRVG